MSAATRANYYLDTPALGGLSLQPSFGLLGKTQEKGKGKQNVEKMLNQLIRNIYISLCLCK